MTTPKKNAKSAPRKGASYRKKTTKSGGAIMMPFEIDEFDWSDAPAPKKAQPRSAAPKKYTTPAKKAPKQDADSFWPEAPPPKKAARKKPPAAPKRPAAQKAYRRTGASTPIAKKGSNAPRPKKTGRSLVVVAAMLAILAGVGAFAASEITHYRQFRIMRASVERPYFYPGVSVDGVSLDGRTREDALAEFAQRERDYADRLTVTLTYGDVSWTLGADQLDFRTNYEAVIHAAYMVGRSGGLEERFAQISDVAERGAAYTVSRAYDEARLKGYTDEIASQLSRPAKDASIAAFDVKSRTFSFSEASEGYRVDAQALYERAQHALNSGQTEAVAVSRQTIAPTVTRSMLAGQYGRITQAVTSASGSSRNRLTNITLSLAAFNGYKLGPGESFSFNTVVGRRTSEKGYKSAGAFLDGLVTEEVGGGICQTSTTLFNAAAKANLTIVERSPHSRPITYVDKGKDAAVSWPGPDLVFKNPTDEPVYLVGYVSDDNRVYVEVYGRHLPDGISIRIDARTTETLRPGADQVTVNPNLAPGTRRVIEKARNGYRAVAYKVYLDASGNEIKREELYRSTYRSAGAVIEVGPS